MEDTNEILDKRITEIIASLDEFDKKELAVKIDALLSSRLKNEFLLSEALLEGVKHDKISLESLKKLINSSKDGVADYVKLKQLLSGLATSVSESHIMVEHVEITDRIEGLQSKNRIASSN